MVTGYKQILFEPQPLRKSIKHHNVIIHSSREIRVYYYGMIKRFKTKEFKNKSYSQ